MIYRFLLFPAGVPGAGLLVLRLSVALFLVSYSVGQFSFMSVPALGCGLLAVVIAVGFKMRVGASLAALVVAVILVTGKSGAAGMFAHGLDAIDRLMAGPGAFSADARLFGRTKIHLVH